MKELTKAAVERWGETAQLLMTVEELNELSVEVMHKIRGRVELGNMPLLEEMADVEIMLEQLKIILESECADFPTDFEAIKTRKLHRLERRLA